jgi:hypothetical protein
MMHTVSINRWNSLKEARNVTNKLYLHTELYEKRLVGRGVFQNDEIFSEEALKKLNQKIENNTFTFTIFSF